MSLDQFLNQVCTINRPTAEVAKDRYNQNKYSGVAVGANVRCRLVEKELRVLDTKSAEYAWVLATLLILPAGTEVQVNDEVIVEEATYLVKQALRRKRGNEAHHVSCLVEVLRG